MSIVSGCNGMANGQKFYGCRRNRTGILLDIYASNVFKGYRVTVHTPFRLLKPEMIILQQILPSDSAHSFRGIVNHVINTDATFSPSIRSKAEIMKSARDSSRRSCFSGASATAAVLNIARAPHTIKTTSLSSLSFVSSSKAIPGLQYVFGRYVPTAEFNIDRLLDPRTRKVIGGLGADPLLRRAIIRHDITRTAVLIMRVSGSVIRVILRVGELPVKHCLKAGSHDDQGGGDNGDVKFDYNNEVRWDGVI